MPIAQADIKLYLSGGAGNTDPNASLGGIISTTELVDATLNNMFDVVSGAESAAGDVEYRCYYVKNTHATLTWQAAKAWISANTPAAGSAIEIGLGTSAIGVAEQSVANESTAPVGVTFGTAVDEANAFVIGDMVPAGYKAIWVKRTISVAAAAYNNDSVVATHKGDTAA